MQGATLTLLGLIIGFSFAMAIGRYDQRRNYEEEEANAIGTEYVRADLLPAADAARTRALLRKCLDRRISFYRSRKAREFSTKRCRHRSPAAGHVVRGAGSGNGATNTPDGPRRFRHERCVELPGCTQAAWRNRIPTAA